MSSPRTAPAGGGAPHNPRGGRRGRSLLELAPYLPPYYQDTTNQTPTPRHAPAVADGIVTFSIQAAPPAPQFADPDNDGPVTFEAPTPRPGAPRASSTCSSRLAPTTRGSTSG
jgi:hypothetical protein